MANWNGLVMTDKGIALQSKVQAGEVLNITKLKLGSGTLPAETDIRKLTDLIKPEQNLGIGGREPNGDYCKISATISNVGLEAGYYVRELGVFAQDPDDGEILYAYTTDGAPDYLPAEGGSTVISQEFSVNIAVSDTDKINVEIDPGALATMGYIQLQIDEHNEDASAHEKAFSQHNTDETAHYDMTGATSSKAGKRGFVPAPKAGDQNKALFGNGTYKQVVETINGIKPDENNNTDLNCKFFNSLNQLSLSSGTATFESIYDAMPEQSELVFLASDSLTPKLKIPFGGGSVYVRKNGTNQASVFVYVCTTNDTSIPIEYIGKYQPTNGFTGWYKNITDNQILSNGKLLSTLYDFANQAEAQAGTDNTKPMTALATAQAITFGSQKGKPWYIKFTNGIVIQGGTVVFTEPITTTSVSKSVTFLVPFIDTNYYADVSISSANNEWGSLQYNAVHTSNTAMTVGVKSIDRTADAGITFDYIAIGWWK